MVPGMVLQRSAKENKKLVTEPIVEVGQPVEEAPKYKNKADMPVAGEYRRMDLPRFW